MSLVLVVLVAALAIGWARGGSLDRLGSLPLRSRRLVVGALAAQLLGAVGGGPLYPLGLIASAALVVAFLVRNRGIRGTGLVAVGLAANALVVGANGAMPVSAEAAGRAGVGVQDLLTGTGARHEPAGADTRLHPLADVIPLPLPLRPEVISMGDVLVAAGLGQLVTLGMIGVGATGRAAGPGRRGSLRRPLPPLPPLATRPSPARRRALPPRHPARPDGES
ncbi:MAG: DUF5317 domain-containing protein [Mycobacteriales bacterium]